MRQWLALLSVGTGIGLVAAVLASQALTTLLLGVSGLDAMTYLGVVGLLASVSALVCGIPARRAATVNPLEALRGE